MPTALQCLVERRPGYLLVRVVGSLDGPATAAPVRTALSRCLVEQPAAVVVDLSAVDACTAAALSVFAAVAHEAARWPVTPLLLSAPSHPVTRLLATPSAHEGMAVFPTVELAAARAGEDPVAPVLADDLLPVLGAARRAREVITDACGRWDQPDLVGPGCVIASELVNNAVEHAGTLIELRVTLRPRALYVSVRDGSPAPPTLGVSASRDVARGLRLVAAESTAWGHLATPDGKVVWAALARPGAPEA